MDTQKPAAIFIFVFIQCFCGGKFETDSLDERLGLQRPVSEEPPSVNLATLTDAFYGTNRSNQDECECVPYYLCNTDKTIKEDGEGVLDIRFGQEQRCNSYMEECCVTPNVLPPDKKIIPSIKPRAYDCGVRNSKGAGFRITNADDNEAQYGEFPWMVVVLKPDPEGRASGIYLCGGSLIHPQVVLTAAHCISGNKQLLVRAGEWDTQTSNEIYPTQDRQVMGIEIHEEYYGGALFNDVALLFLETPMDLAENVATICLPEQGEIMDGRNCIATGWGKDVFGKEGRYQAIMKKVELPVVPRSSCLESLRMTRLGKYFKLHESFICAGGELGRDTCKGDGGSPLACPIRENPDIYRQAGIVAWGINCGDATPGVYVNVPLFRNWIDNKLSFHNFS